MEKILNGVVRFHERMAEEMRPNFFRLVKEGQHPRALFITCADSRIVPDLITSTDPGDLFILRNIGNLIPPYNEVMAGNADTSAAAAIEYSLKVLQVRNIIVCGHSDCGAMKAVLSDQTLPAESPLRRWLAYAQHSLELMDSDFTFNNCATPYDQLAQLNALLQLERLREYPIVRERMNAGELYLHAFFHVIENAEVLAFHPGRNRFAHVNEETVRELMYWRDVFEDSPEMEKRLNSGLSQLAA